MNLIIFFDGNKYDTCGWIGSLPDVPSADLDPKLFGLPAVTQIVAVITNWQPDQIILMPHTTIKLSR